MYNLVQHLLNEWCKCTMYIVHIYRKFGENSFVYCCSYPAVCGWGCNIKYITSQCMFLLTFLLLFLPISEPNACQVPASLSCRCHSNSASFIKDFLYWKGILLYYNIILILEDPWRNTLFSFWKAFNRESLFLKEAETASWDKTHICFWKRKKRQCNYYQ